MPVGSSSLFWERRGAPDNAQESQFSLMRAGPIRMKRPRSKSGSLQVNGMEASHWQLVVTHEGHTRSQAVTSLSLSPLHPSHVQGPSGASLVFPMRQQCALTPHSQGTNFISRATSGGPSLSARRVSPKLVLLVFTLWSQVDLNFMINSNMAFFCPYMSSSCLLALITVNICQIH